MTPHLEKNVLAIYTSDTLNEYTLFEKKNLYKIELPFMVVYVRAVILVLYIYMYKSYDNALYQKKGIFDAFVHRILTWWWQIKAVLDLISSFKQ